MKNHLAMTLYMTLGEEKRDDFNAYDVCIQFLDSEKHNQQFLSDQSQLNEKENGSLSKTETNNQNRTNCTNKYPPYY